MAEPQSPVQTTLTAALEYVRLGWRVLPLHEVTAEGACSCRKSDCDSIGKHPRGGNGSKHATTDTAQIEEWWTRWPTANVGVATGPESDLFMVGPDGQSGIDAFAELVRDNGPLPATPVARTGSAGRHLLFRWPTDGEIRNAKNHRGTPIDIRGTGGYFVAAPSRNKNGSYEWEVSPSTVPLVEAPAWLLEWSRTKNVPNFNLRAEPAGPDVRERAVLYLAKCEPAVSGQGGHDQTFKVARAIVYGFNLGTEVGFEVIREHYNPRCEPIWSESELRHKCEDADRIPYSQPRGYLLSENNGRANSRGTGTGAQPSAPDELARLKDVLDAGGVDALFRDKPLLQALASLAEANPAAFGVLRDTLKKSKVSLHDLDAALKPLRREQIRERPPVLLSAAGYRIAGDCIVRNALTRDGPVEVPLCNFVARITEVVTHDDGAEQTSHFTLAGTLASGRELAPVQVAAAEFVSLGWVTTAWHGEAVVYAGQGNRDHLRTAIELLSRDRVRRTVYTHTGWRRIGEAWYYLHAGGAIGPPSVDVVDGPISVETPAALSKFSLPTPPTGEALATAIRASLALLDGLTHDHLIFPLLGATYRAALGEAPGGIDLSLFLAGQHGVFKSSLAALAQQHYGAGLHGEDLPGSWLSTGNALEGLAFAAKDSLLTIDDWAPQGAVADVQRLRRDADRVFRAQGNRAGRLRMRADGSLRTPKPPRGLILSTGEDIPPGQSLRGRLLILEVSKGDVQVDRLTLHQQAGAAGLFAQAMAGFLAWIAPQYDELCGQLPGERVSLRDKAQTGSGSPRTPGIAADLAIGLNLFFDFAVAAGVITNEQRAALAQRGWQALLVAADLQADHVQAAEPTALFLRLLVAALASGRAHVAGPDGLEPKTPAGWGWRGQEYPCRGESGFPATEISWQAQGRRIGWIDGEDLYLEPEASHAAAQEMAGAQGDSLPISARTLHRRLKERGLLASWDAGRQRNTVRRTLEGARHREVLHLRQEALSSCIGPSTPSTDSENNKKTAVFSTFSVDGCVAATVHTASDRPPEPSTSDDSIDGSGGRSDGQVDGCVDATVHLKTAENGRKPQKTPAGGQCGRSDMVVESALVDDTEVL